NTRHCANNELIGSDKAKYADWCQRSDSKGWRSAHNCKIRGGSSYLCVRCGLAHCYPIDSAFKLGLEGGECFL
ncbi:hypothetical protein QBC38DRAFT_372922, partial [Podospora fimiseda]